MHQLAQRPLRKSGGQAQNRNLLIDGQRVVGNAKQVINGYIEVLGNSDFDGVGWFAFIALIRGYGVFIDAKDGSKLILRQACILSKFE